MLASWLIGSALAILGTEGPTLEWEAPEGCPEQAVVDELLLDPPQGADYVPVHARARVVHRDDHYWVLELEIETETGRQRRTVDARSCRELAQTTALVTSINAWGPAALGVVGASSSASAPERQRPRPAAEPETARSAPSEDVLGDPVARAEPSPPLRSRARTPGPRLARSASTQPPRWRLGALVGSGVGTGALPSVDIPLAVGATLAGPHWRAELSGRYWVRRRAESSELASVGVDLDLFSALAAGGYVLRVVRLEFPLQAGLELGTMRGTGVGVDAARTERSVWATAGVLPGITWRAHQNVALWARVHGYLTLRRPQYWVEGLGEVYRAPPGGVRFALGLELQFGPGARI